PGELLRDRTAAAADPAVHHEPDRRAHDPTEVEAVVLVEAPVFDRDEGLRDVRRELVECDLRPALDAQLLDEDPVVAEDLGRLGRLPDVDLRDRRALVADVSPASEREAAAHRDQREEDDHTRRGQAWMGAKRGETAFLPGFVRHRLLVLAGPGSGVAALLHAKLATRFPPGKGGRYGLAPAAPLECFVHTHAGARFP